jgi:hypothetical protein
MKPLLIALFATLPLAACTTYGGGRVGASIAYDGFYDDYYGPIYNGYWGEGDVFYYRSGHRGQYIRDDSHHFHRDMASAPAGNFHPMHVMGPAPKGHGRGHP